ncbi:Transketolase, C-terminal domain [Thermoanaerobacter thermohydrosulfuricus]|uniref:Transketolase, C-terminal domain n=3 Tax=Thermoanaerobacter TaxID=1754 RepID=A0A1G7R4I0_THETY|nr:Transketolase, C-terminal domain [Thermoanaerobacter thermohydrosulfuricus]
MVAIAIEAADKLKEEGIEATVVNIHTIKPIDKDLIVEVAKKTGKVITAEEHNIIGGLGSAVAEVLSEEYPVKIKRIGIKDQFGKSGSPKELLKYYGLTAEDIVKNSKAILKIS